MTTPILLPPLPDEFLMHPTQGECYTADQLRARDLETARAVLEAVKDACAPSGPWHHYETASECRAKIDALKVKHYE